MAANPVTKPLLAEFFQPRVPQILGIHNNMKLHFGVEDQKPEWGIILLFYPLPARRPFKQFPRRYRHDMQYIFLGNFD